MMPWFIWKGKNSLGDFGLWIGKLPKRIRPEERCGEVEIPGRAGSVILLEGEDVYSAYSDEMVVIARNTLPMDSIMEWLRGSSELIVSTDLSKAREARIVGQVAFERISNDLMQSTIPFLFQPFRKSIHPQQSDRITITGTTGSIINPGDVASKPLVSITGSGNKTITIDGHGMTFSLGSSSVTIVVDCDTQIITSANTVWTGSFTGDFWRIPKGTSTFTQSSNTTTVIDPNWRWF